MAPVCFYLADAQRSQPSRRCRATRTTASLARHGTRRCIGSRSSQIQILPLLRMPSQPSVVALLRRALGRTKKETRGSGSARRLHLTAHHLHGAWDRHCVCRLGFGEPDLRPAHRHTHIISSCVRHPPSLTGAPFALSLRAAYQRPTPKPTVAPRAGPQAERGHSNRRPRLAVWVLCCHPARERGASHGRSGEMLALWADT